MVPPRTLRPIPRATNRTPDVSLRNQLEDDLKAAMRARNETARDTLRMVLSAVKGREIDSNRDLSDDEVLALVASGVKTRRESIDQYEKAGRADLAERELAEIAVLEPYLPQQLSEEETRKVVEGLVQELGLQSKAETGKLMKALMAAHKGVVDGKLAQRIAGELLG